MADPTGILVVACASLAGAGLASAAFLRGWRGWLELKRMETGQARGGDTAFAAGRIELADLKARVRRLEAIADGTEI